MTDRRPEPSITIVGAGLAGSLLATLLARQGFSVTLFDRGPDPRIATPAAGRSINLALAERGRHALALAGLLDAVQTFAIPMRGRMLHEPGQTPRLQPYGAREDEVIYSVHRRRLNGLLLDAARQHNRVRCYFSHTLESVDFADRRLLFRDSDGATHRHNFERLIGADGAGSRVRRSLQAATDIQVREELLDHGYKEFRIPPGPGDPDRPEASFRIDPNALHIWPRGGFMTIALPNADGSFTVTLFLPRDGNPGFEQLDTPQRQQQFMTEQFPDLVPLMPDLLEDFRDNPVGILGTIRCSDWHLDGRALLIGDAAHAVVPFHGQGMNAAFEDCAVLAEMLRRRGGTSMSASEWENLLAAFSRRRRPNANAIADMALENYDIMRDAVRAPDFLRRKALEHELERRFPDRFVGRYSLVMFHRIDYREAYRRGQIQAAILDRILATGDDLDSLDYARAETLITQRLTPLPDRAGQPL